MHNDEVRQKDVISYHARIDAALSLGQLRLAEMIAFRPNREVDSLGQFVANVAHGSWPLTPSS